MPFTVNSNGHCFDNTVSQLMPLLQIMFSLVNISLDNRTGYVENDNVASWG